MTLAAGTRLGPYEIVALIGQGGMGEVYRSRDPRLDRQVAVKLLPSHMAADQHARDRLRQEAMAAAALSHPYICKLFEVGEDGDSLFLVMEFIVGENLHERMRNGRIAMPETLHVAGEVAEALQEAQNRGILHRDLKPANIMVTQQGHLKIMDFGLAKRLIEPASGDGATLEGGAAQLTAPGTILGTPDYMSPEQVKGAPLDVRSDLFSFGVILAEMATGQHPFRRQSTAETLSAVLRETPELGGDVPAGFAALVRRLLQKNAEDRYASIADVRADLARLGGSTEASASQIASAVTEEKTRAGAAARARRAWRWPALAPLVIVIGLLAYFATHTDGAIYKSRGVSLVLRPEECADGDVRPGSWRLADRGHVGLDCSAIAGSRTFRHNSAAARPGK